MIRNSLVWVLLIGCSLAVKAQTDTVPAVRDSTARAVEDTVIVESPAVVQPQITKKRKPPYSTDPVYRLKAGADIPIIAIGTGWSLYAFTKIYSKDAPGEEKILSLNKADINDFDEWAVRPYSKSIDRASYIPFFASMPLPLVFFLTGEKMRKDFFKLSALYWETMSITGLLYTGATYFNDRFRPYAYSPETEMPQRNRGGAQNSFYAGHVALVASSMFFIAKVYGDYYPNSNGKWVLYTIASLTTGATAYMRHQSGQHFPSDLLLGIAQGTLTGILVPHFHKHRMFKDPNLTVVPYTTGYSNGIAVRYKL